ncbi:hypothetical protein BZA77DRAFT_322667 [Pyronema omphalodes]|nr:hypothetical protein BZA77DRAFT_322667 [Pyronema omphalodes]
MCIIKSPAAFQYAQTHTEMKWEVNDDSNGKCCGVLKNDVCSWEGPADGPEGPGYHRFKCKFWLTYNCNNWTWVNGSACAECVSQGRDDIEATDSGINGIQNGDEYPHRFLHHRNISSSY